MKNTVGARLAMSVAALFMASCKGGSNPSKPPEGEAAAGGGTVNTMPSEATPSGKVQCLGIHECKGKSACHVIGSHACAGQNECKGKGWIHVPAPECEAKGGKVLDS